MPEIIVCMMLIVRGAASVQSAIFTIPSGGAYHLWCIAYRKKIPAGNMRSSEYNERAISDMRSAIYRLCFISQVIQLDTGI